MEFAQEELQCERNENHDVLAVMKRSRRLVLVKEQGHSIILNETQETEDGIQEGEEIPYLG